jgi:tetratricopeptide (TPR) repeat protein
MRGRIRSLQLRTEEAWDHFDRALDLAAEAPVTIANLVREFLLNLYLFDNALLEGPVDRSAKIPEARIPELPPHVMEEYPEVAYVISLRHCAEGYLRLHLGEFAKARRIFGDLIDGYRSSPDATLGFYYCGLAAAEHNMGHRDRARRTLENAGLAVLAGGRTLNQARLAGVLEAFHAWLGAEEEGRSWKAFLDRLPCPEATKEAFSRRGELLLERCTQEKCLLLI